MAADNEPRADGMTARDDADLAAMQREPDTADDGRHMLLHAEQPVDALVEGTQRGMAVVEFVGAMLGQLAQHVEDIDGRVDWTGASILFLRTTEPELANDGSHLIIPAGTLKLVLNVKVRPANG